MGLKLRWFHWAMIGGAALVLLGRRAPAASSATPGEDSASGASAPANSFSETLQNLITSLTGSSASPPPSSTTETVAAATQVQAPAPAPAVFAPAGMAFYNGSWNSDGASPPANFNDGGM